MNPGVSARTLLCAAAFLWAAPALGQDTEWNRYTLDGLDGVYVSARANEACEGAGVSAESVRAEAEALLEATEVPLLSRDEMLAAPGLPELEVAYECGGGVAGMVGYSVSVRMLQAVQMIRNTQITLSTSVTWHASSVGVSQAGSASRAFSTALEDTLAQFSEAFHAANAEETEG